MAEFVLTDIYVYPIKSLGGVRVSQAIIEPRGLQYDRRWLLVDETDKFLTQRVHPQMALFAVELQAAGLRVTYRPDLPDEDLFIPFDQRQYSNVPRTVTIWDDTVRAVEVSAAANNWFSQRLPFACRLVFMPPAAHRPVEPDYAPASQPVSFADAYPYLLIGQASLDDLNARLPEPVPMNRFRPNLVFAGGEPFAEDAWQEFSVGTQQFAAVKPSSRCVLITINQQTAAKGPEPLRTLAGYRRQNNKVLFGQNVLPRTVGGHVRVGDLLTVQTYRSS